VGDDGITVLQRPPEVLAAAPDCGDAMARQDRTEIRGPTGVSPDGAVVEHLDVGDAAADQMRAEPATHDLDLG
jgi:hypothetical protein